jgi:dTDP-4-dehydrorhamnose 3,5-epimerase
MSFTARRLAIPDVILIRTSRFDDARGYFMETYRAREFAGMGVGVDFVQENEALSSRAGTIRGLHFQRPPHSQAKLLRVLKGSIFDVAVDLREGSSTFGRWVGARLTAETGEQLYVPHGFAHGYCTLEDDTVLAYKCDNYYAAHAEGGVVFSDPDLGIDWPLPDTGAIVADKDRALPRLRDISAAVISLQAT